MPKEKILLAPSIFGTPDKTPLNKLIAKGYDIVQNPHQRRLSKDELLKLLPGVSGIIAGLEPLDREVLRQSKLRVISRCGSGLSNVDINAAKEFKIHVCSTPFGPVESVAELTVGAMIGLARNMFVMNADMHQGKWNKSLGIELQGKTVAIIGFGRIGQRVAELLKPFDLKIVAVDQHAFTHSEVKQLSIEEALKSSDIISLHCSGDEQVIGDKEFSIMKQGAYLINAARGGVVNETALVSALEKNIIAGAWLDCFATEPYSGPLAKFPQAVLTPHIGSYTAECRSRMEMEAVNNLIEAMEQR